MNGFTHWEDLPRGLQLLHTEIKAERINFSRVQQTDSC